MGALQSVVAISGFDLEGNFQKISGTEATRTLHFDDNFVVRVDTTVTPPRVLVTLSAAVLGALAEIEPLFEQVQELGDVTIPALTDRVEATEVYAVAGGDWNTTTPQETDYVASVGDHVLLNLSGGAVDVYLPAATVGNAGRCIRVSSVNAGGGDSRTYADGVQEIVDYGGFYNASGIIALEFMSIGTGWVVFVGT
jgi:hypothetical protein